jgi:hypothetical protein
MNSRARTSELHYHSTDAVWASTVRSSLDGRASRARKHEGYRMGRSKPTDEMMQGVGSSVLSRS